MHNTMNICIISDDNYIEYASTLIVSILKNSKKQENLYFHFIDLDIKEENKNKIISLKEIKNFDIKFYNPNYNNIEKYKKWQKVFKENGFPLWHYSVFIKLDIPFLLKHLDKVLYLDADTLVIDNISHIFEMDISNYFISCQYNCFKNLKKYFPTAYDYMLELGYSKPEYSYIGGSVLLFNNKKIIENFDEESLNTKMDECFNKYNKLIFTEEMIFSYIFKDFIGFLDFKTDHGYSDRIAIVVIYLTADGKILKDYFNRPINEYYYKFWEYFSLTPFFKENPIKYINIYLYHRDLYNLEKYNSLECKLNIIDNNTTLIINILKHIINSIAWWIPIKSLRNNFRAKFKIEDQTRPDQTRPDQTRPLIYNDYIYFYNNIKKQKLQPMLQYSNAA